MENAMITESTRSLSSAGAFAPIHLAWSSSDPLAGFRQRSAATEGQVISIPVPRQTEPENATQLSIQFGSPLGPAFIPVAQLGWTLELAGSVRDSLRTFADDWDEPEMSVYDEPEER